MNAKELRIGNLVQYGIQVKEIKSFTRTDIKPIETTIYIGLTYRLKNYPVDFREIKPIPLREEWLRKFGFKFSREKSGTLGIYSNGKANVILSNSGNVYTMRNKLIAHVHTFQNWYYYDQLTGEELTIKIK